MLVVSNIREYTSTESKSMVSRYLTVPYFTEKTPYPHLPPGDPHPPILPISYFSYS